MQISLLKKLTLVVVIASTYAITGCSDANSKNPVPSQNAAQPAEAATTSIANTQASEEEKRNAESGNALY
ncbi:MAG: hypothetical protein ACXWJK_05910 [Burkholderiaceae bacterium]